MVQESGRFSIDRPTGETPLRRFSGELKGIKKQMGKNETSGREWEAAQFDFIDVEVIEATEPYPYPTASLFIFYSDPHSFRTNRENPWEALAESVRGFKIDLYDLVGKRQTWAMLPASVRAGLVDEEGNPILETEGQYAGKQKWGPVIKDCWKVVEVAGLESPASGGDIMDHVANLADGKNEADFRAALYTDTLAKQNPRIIEEATHGTLLQTLAATGLVYRDDDGIWHKGNGNGAQPEQTPAEVVAAGEAETTGGV